MRLTSWEEERLLIFTAAQLAGRHRARGLLLNAPEAIALICDAMFEAARAGATYPEIEAAGRGAVRPSEVLPGIRELIEEVRLEVLMDDGTRLVVLVDPLRDPGAGTVAATGADGAKRDDAPGREALAREALAPGGVQLSQGAGSDPTPGRERRTIEVTNTSRRVVRVSSHYPFDRVNPRLVFDRALAAGFRLDLPAGATERWAPGETRTVLLVGISGEHKP